LKLFIFDDALRFGRAEALVLVVMFDEFTVKSLDETDGVFIINSCSTS
jgi:hypothetical protein